ncbi:peptide chain release factor 2 [Patescibacteria group bacterium]
MKDISEKIEDLSKKILYLEDCLDLAKKEKRIEELEKESQKPDFWQDKEKAVKVSQELADLRKETSQLDELKAELEEIKELEDEAGIEGLEEKILQKELQIFLSGKYDSNDAILSIYSGAGGVDSQDWATMLLRMYERYCSFKGFKTKVLDHSFGEAGGPEGRIGTKSVTLEVKGSHAFGFLKGESGVHRLVRISPFSAKSLRHTSFAQVEVLPEISKTEEIEIKPDDLRVETFRASGPGGQYVNRRETAVRITHIPTKISVSCQVERLQGLNKKKAMQVLAAKLYQWKVAKEEKELKEIKASQKKKSLGQDNFSFASWGNQIRTYVFHPYQLVKDLRTGVETSDVESVLDGNLDKFIAQQIRGANFKK